MSGNNEYGFTNEMIIEAIQFIRDMVGFEIGDLRDQSVRNAAKNILVLLCEDEMRLLNTRISYLDEMGYTAIAQEYAGYMDEYDTQWQEKRNISIEELYFLAREVDTVAYLAERIHEIILGSGEQRYTRRVRRVSRRGASRNPRLLTARRR